MPEAVSRSCELTGENVQFNPDLNCTEVDIHARNTGLPSRLISPSDPALGFVGRRMIAEGTSGGRTFL